MDFKNTTCTQDCSDVCGLLVKGGADSVIRGNPDHPFTAGFICSRIKGMFARLQNKERVSAPRLRTRDIWEEISWERAMALCTEKLGAALDRNPASVLHIQGHGAKGVLQEATGHVFAQLGARSTCGSFCDDTGIEASLCDFGALDHNRIEDLANAGVIVNWGRDLYRGSVHLAAIVRRARKNGTRVISICPGGKEYYEYSDEVIRVQPGQDRFLACAVIRRMAERGRISGEVLEKTAGWKAFYGSLGSRSVADLAGLAGVSTGDVDRLAEVYSGNDPVSTLIGWGVQRYLRGGETVRCIDALAWLSGNVGRSGAGVWYNISSMRNFNLSMQAPFTPEPFALPGIGKSLLEARDPKVEFVWVSRGNVVNQAPDSKTVAAGLQQAGFTVVVDAFMTDTAECADLVLPCSLMLEQEDVVGSFMHDWVGYARKVVDPPKGVRSDYEIMRDLVSRLDRKVDLPEPDDIFEQALDSPWLNITLKGLREKGFAQARRGEIAFEGGKTCHQDGRFHLVEKVHFDEGERDGRYPLQLLTLIRRSATHSQIPAERQTEPPRVWVNPASAGLAGTEPEKKVFLASPLGRLEVRVEFDETLVEDVVVYRRGDWMCLGGGANQLLAPLETDMGRGTAYYGQGVRLEN